MAGTEIVPGRPRSGYAQVLGREMHFVEWGRADAPPVILWHGLARTGRDFDALGHVLSDRFRLIAPDTIGRGLSEWSATPDEDYCMARYAETAEALADALGLATFGWIGTSMGGAIGIRAAGNNLSRRITRLVINDIGPTFPPAPYKRIREYVGKPPEFRTIGDMIAYFKTIYQPFGWHSEAQWRHMAETSSRRLPNGHLTTHYDPAIVRQLIVHPNDYEQWESWDRIGVPTLVLRGVESDLLLADTAAEMSRRGPKARIVEIPGCGHAPALNVDSQIAIIREFLAA